MSPPIDAAGTAGATQGFLGPGGLGKEDFLRLLVTQLQYQDPLDPLDAQDFASQLAEFSSMEQQLITNDLLEQQIEMNSAAMLESQTSVAIGMIGKEVVTDGGRINLDGSGDAGAYVATSGPATLQVELTDSAGRVVLRVNTTVSGTGVQRIDLGDDADGLAPGTYTMSVEVLGGSEGTTVRPLSSGVVQGVRWGDAGPVLVVGQQEVPLSNVLEITS